uniref:Protein kinase interacting protein n=1 Tax=Antheraea pernyi nuclear polyhedrosis virus TaxID=161494 RepID=A0A1V1FMF6_NPVAP|nr:protein kinase interacting protein [Antheraea pernyi nucleopolyhedrovirus]
MEADLCAAVNTGRALLNAAFKQQDKKIAKYFAKPCEGGAEKMLMLAADIYGQIEQLEALLSVAHAPDSQKLEFARDCSDLDMDPAVLARVCAGDAAHFATKYGASQALARYPVAYDAFLRHSERFADAARNLSGENVNQLVKSKCAAIRHLCALEYLVGLHVNKIN